VHCYSPTLPIGGAGLKNIAQRKVLEIKKYFVSTVLFPLKIELILNDFTEACKKSEFFISILLD